MYGEHFPFYGKLENGDWRIGIGDGNDVFQDRDGVGNVNGDWNFINAEEEDIIFKPLFDKIVCIKFS